MPGRCLLVFYKLFTHFTCFSHYSRVYRSHFIDIFLSRLCGGQVAAGKEEAKELFLSRLCGGQGIYAMSGTSSSFLSRLCGGQDYVVIYEGSEVFLSRLCGGQVIV